MIFKLIESNLTFLESKYRGNGVLKEFILSILQTFPDPDNLLSADNYQVHHKEYTHSENNYKNIILLPVYKNKDKQANKYVSPNSALHGKYPNNAEDSYTFLNQLKAIDVGESIDKKTVTVFEGGVKN